MTSLSSRLILTRYRTIVAFVAILVVTTVTTIFVHGTVGAGQPVTPVESAFNQDPIPSPTPCCGSADDKPHLLMGSYYSLNEEFSAKLLLNNKGSLPLVAHPRLFSMSGERFDVAPITIAPESFQMINLAEWVEVAGPQFHEGSVQVFHLGRDLVLGSQIYLVSQARSLGFDEKLVEKGGFKSAKLEGLWWLPASGGEIRLAVANTSDSPLTAIVTADGKSPRRSGTENLYLNPHETRVLNIQTDVFDYPQDAMSRAGGISIHHSGAPGDLLARGMAQNTSGYSLSIQFGDPAAGKSAKLQGAGFRLGNAGPESLTPIVIARNVGNSTATVTGRFRYSSSNGSESTITLPQVVLSPGEIDDVDVARAVREHGKQNLKVTGSLEFEYSGAAGSVTMTALSIGNGGTQVFRVPMWDIYAQKSSTGGYPWLIEGSSSTIVYIKNAEAHAQQYYFQLKHSDGLYSLGINRIEAGQTIKYDIAELRDQQVPDVRGRLIPLDANSGQIHWTKTGTESGMLIGRSEQVDMDHGLSSSYACVNCCPDNAVNPRIVPNTQTNIVSGESQFIAEHQLTTCYGGFSDWVGVFSAQWQSSNENIATVFFGFATGVAPGTTTIRADWFEPRNSWRENDVGIGGIEGFGGGSCVWDGMNHLTAQATFNVKPHVTVTEVGFSGDFRLTRWSDGTAIDPNDNVPTWKSEENPDLPAAYKSGSTVKMFATLGINPSISNTSVKIRVKRGNDVMGVKDVTISGSSTTVTNITTMLVLESTVKTTSPTFTWEISYDGGTKWFPMNNSGPHKIHWTYDAPLGPPFRNDNGHTDSAIYDLAVEKASGYANGSADLSTIISRINTGVDNETVYNPGNSIGSFHPLKAYTTLSGIQCSDEANLLRGLLRSIGIDGSVLFVWAGPNANTMWLYRVGNTGLAASFRITRASHDASPTNPHFTFHAVVSTNGTWYDPSFGLTYSSLPFTETAFNNTPQQVHTSPWMLEQVTGYVCPH